MRSLLLLLLTVACVLPIAWAAACGDSNSYFGDGCDSTGAIEAGFICPSSGKCTLSPAGLNVSNTAANLVFQTNFNNGIFDISRLTPTTPPASFSTTTSVTCNKRDIADDLHAGYCTFAGPSASIVGPIPTNFPSGSTKRTTCMWMRPQGIVANGVSNLAFSYGPATSPTAGTGWAVGIQGNGGANRVIATGYTTSFVATSTTVPASSWTHVCAAFTDNPVGKGITVWVSGTPTTGQLGGVALNTASSGNLNLGAHVVAAFGFTGDLFDIRQYNDALTDSQVQAIMNEGYANHAIQVMPTVSCGNGIFESGEGCDDNNLISGDGCDAFCHVEPRWYCSGSPSVCAPKWNMEINANAEPNGVLTDISSTTQQSSSTIDVSGLSWTPAAVQYSRTGDFYYTISGLVPSSLYTIDFVFAETIYNAAQQRIFNVEVQGASPQWSPIDIFAIAGRLNYAIGKSFTTLSDPQGVITIEFYDNAEVQALRYTRVSTNIASFTTAGVITVANSDTSASFNPASGYPDFTMEVYAYPTTTAASTLIGKGSDFSLSLSATGKAVCVVGGVTVSGGTALPNNKWTHVACVVDSTAGKAYIYLNGMRDATQAGTFTWAVSSTNVILGTTFLGALDRPRLWQRALSASELLANSLSSAATPALASYGLIEEWTFDSPTSTPSVTGTYGSTASFAAATNIFDAGVAVTGLGINCGGTQSTIPTMSADSFFVGGTSATTTATIDDPLAIGLSQQVYKSARTGAFSYVLTGLPAGQSYRISVVMADYTGDTSSMSLYINQIQVLKNFDLFTDYGQYMATQKIFTATADYAGTLTLQFTGAATVSYLQFQPIAAPAGSARFYKAITNRAPMRLGYEALSVIASTAPSATIYASNLQGHASSAPFTPSIDAVYTGAVGASTLSFTVPNLIPAQVYLVRLHFAELNPTYATAAGRKFDIKLVQDSGTTTWQAAFDIYTSAGSKLYTSYSLKKFLTANADGSITVQLDNANNFAILNGLEVIPGPSIFGSSQTFPLDAATVVIPGAHLLSVAMQSSTLAVSLKQGATTTACASINVKLNSVECTIPASALTAGSVSALMLIDGTLVAEVPLGTVLPALSVTPSSDFVGTNTAKLVLIGTGFSDIGNVEVGLATSAIAAASIACDVLSASPQVIVCKPASNLPLGPIYAVVTSSGATTATNMQVGTVIAAPQLGAVATVYATSSTMVITGKGFIPSPYQGMNSVVLTQASHSRKRSLTPSTAPSCPIISATTTTITCALSNVGAGSLSVTVQVAGGSSTTLTVTVQSSYTGSCSPPFGAPDAYDNTLCNCWSGYAPSSSFYTDCSVNPTCIREIVTGTSTGPAMSTPKTSFYKDHLRIYQSSPIVNNRRDTTIRFSVPTGLSSIIPITAVPGSVGSPSCGYPGNLWLKTIDASECRDVYTASIPWSGHTLCGFVTDNGATNSTHLIFKAQMDTTYISAYPTSGGGYLERVSTDSFIVTVAFRKTITFTSTISTEFAESTIDDFVTISVDGSDYDPNTRTMVVVLTAETSWPYQLNLAQVSSGVFFSDLGASSDSIISTFTGSVDNDQFGQTDIYACSAQQDSVCVQIMIAKFIVTNTSLCDIAGTFQFNETQLLCRDVNLGEICPGDPITTVEFQVGATNLCEDAALDPSGSIIPSLTAYSTHKDIEDGPQSEFYDNDIPFFVFSLESDLASVDSVTFSRIQVSLNPDNGSPDIIYDITQNPAQLIPNISLELHEIHTLIRAGQPMSANFSFQLSTTRLVNTVQHLAMTSPGIPSQLLISATVDILFHGNSRKRSVSFDFVTSGTSKTAHHPITFHHVARSNVAIHQQSHNNNNDEEAKNGIMPAIGVDNIWAELNGNEQQTEFGDWFGALESSGYKVNVSFFMLVACYLLVHIFIIA